MTQAEKLKLERHKAALRVVDRAPEVTQLQRLARKRIWDLTCHRDGVWHGTCPNCGYLPPVSHTSFEVHADRFYCLDCGVQGDAVTLVRCHDGVSDFEARAVIEAEAPP